MTKKLDLQSIIWKKFNMLTAIWEPLKQEGYPNRRVRCRCDCGVEKDLFLSPLLNLKYQSCSCKQYADMRINNRTHWMSWWWKWKHTKIYSARHNIQRRLSNPSKKERCYIWIKCLWNTFEEFNNDMYESLLEHIKIHWDKNTSIDRINPYWDYSKENCRWATIEVQSFNKRNSIYIEYNWIAYRAKDLSKITGIAYKTLVNRYRNYEKWLLEYKDITKHLSRNINYVKESSSQIYEGGQ